MQTGNRVVSPKGDHGCEQSQPKQRNIHECQPYAVLAKEEPGPNRVK